MDKYGYIGIETLLNFCENSKDHAVTPNDFMRMNRARVPERKMGYWECVPHKSVEHGEVVIDGDTVRCSNCRHAEKGWNAGMHYCPHCGAKMEV